LDLSLYTGIVLVQGVVQKEQNGMFIVEVTSISGASAGILSGDTANTMTQQGTYIASA